MKSKKQLFVEKLQERNRKGIKSMKKLQDFLSNYKGHIPSRQELVEMEIRLCSKLQFKLTQPTLSSTLHEFVQLWDNFAQQKQKTCFKFNEGAKEKMKHVGKVTQLLLIHHQQQQNDHRKYKPLVLSAMLVVLQLTSNSTTDSFIEGIQKMRRSKQSMLSDRSELTQLLKEFTRQVKV